VVRTWTKGGEHGDHRPARLSRVVPLVLLEGASIGFAVWAIASRSILAEYSRSNGLDAPSRRFVFLDMGIGIVVAAAVVVAILARKRGAGIPLVERLAWRCSPLALAGAVPLLFDARIWPDREPVFFTAVVAFALAFRTSLLAAWRSGPLLGDGAGRWGARIEAARGRLRALRERTWRSVGAVGARVDAPLVFVLLGVIGYAVYFSVITITAHRNLATGSFDLGLEDNLMWNLIHGGPLFKSSPFSGPTGSHLGHHATFFAFVIAPIYALAPRPETLLILQATLMGAAAVPLFLYARRHIPAWAAAEVATMYLLYPPLHGANLYDFHYLPLGVFFLWLVLYAVESRRHVLAVCAALLALSVREDVAASLGVIGAFLLVTGAAAVEGGVLALVGVGYFVGMKLFLMPRFKGGAESFVNQYAGLLPPGSKGFGGILETILGNPAFTGNVLLEQEKLTYGLQIFAPLVFLPLRYPIAVLLVAPGIFFTLLSTNYWPLVHISFQYTSYWTAFLFVGLVVTLARLSRPQREGDTEGPRRLAAVMASLVAAMTFCTCYNGAFFRNPTVHGGFAQFSFETTPANLRRRGELAELIAKLPPDARVVASESLVPHVSGRREAYTLRFGTWDAEYLLIDVPLGGDERNNAYPLLRRGEFGVVADLGDLALAKRGYPTDGNDRLLRR
jgi:uncharacterized membrane protein